MGGTGGHRDSVSPHPRVVAPRRLGRGGAGEGQGGTVPVMMSSMVPSLPSYTGRWSLAWRRRSSAISSCCCHLLRCEGGERGGGKRSPGWGRCGCPLACPTSPSVCPPRAHLLLLLSLLRQQLLSHHLLLLLPRFVLLLRILPRGGDSERGQTAPHPPTHAHPAAVPAVPCVCPAAHLTL